MALGFQCWDHRCSGPGTVALNSRALWHLKSATYEETRIHNASEYGVCYCEELNVRVGLHVCV